jgi:hypothetical protein
MPPWRLAGFEFSLDARGQRAQDRRVLISSFYSRFAMSEEMELKGYSITVYSYLGSSCCRDQIEMKLIERYVFFSDFFIALFCSIKLFSSLLATFYSTLILTCLPSYEK